MIPVISIPATEVLKLIHNSLPRHIAGALAAAAAYAAAYFIMPLSIFAPAAIAFVPAVLSAAAVYSGCLWALAGAVCAAAGALLGAGAPYAGAALVGLALPAALQYAAYRRRVEFERALRINVCGFFVLGLGALLLLRACVGDLADAQVAYVRRLWDSLVSFDVMGGGMQRSLESRSRLLSLFAASGYLSSDLIAELNASPTADVYARSIDYILFNLRYVMSYTLSGNLIASALGVGVIMTAWPRMLAMRSAADDAAPFVPLRKWFLPGDAALFACIAYAFAVLALPFMPEWWYGVDYALKETVSVAMCIQGVAALERWLRRNGTPRGIRGAALLISVMMFRTLVSWVGAASALFGSQGVISGWLRRMSDDD